MVSIALAVVTTYRPTPDDLPASYLLIFVGGVTLVIFVAEALRRKGEVKLLKEWLKWTIRLFSAVATQGCMILLGFLIWWDHPWVSVVLIIFSIAIESFTFALTMLVFIREVEAARGFDVIYGNGRS
jgi:hypothetical protein